MATVNDPVAADIALGRAKQLAQTAARIIQMSREFQGHYASVDPATLEAADADVIAGTRLSVSNLKSLKALTDSVLALAAANDAGYTKLVALLAGMR